MADSRIEWTGSTWNPVTGCTKVSLGCKNCYAERMAERLRKMGQPNYRNGFEVTVHEHVLNYPLSWKKPKIIFVNSMSDLFHDRVSDDFIFKVFKIMNKAYWHQFQILTKRSQRLKDLAPLLNWSDNIWAGVSVENEKVIDRVDDLRFVPSIIRFLSMEPLLSPVADLDLSNIDWVIVGGESGPGARVMKEKWVLQIKEQCNLQTTKFFFKQWGGINKNKTGRLLEGKKWDDMPETSFKSNYKNAL